MSAVTGDLKLVKQGYADLFEKDEMKGYTNRCLNFTVRFYAMSQLCAAVRMVKEYNEFRGARLADALQTVADYILWGEFGREGSPVLYLTVATGQEDIVRNSISRLNPDEISITNGRMRIWWD